MTNARATRIAALMGLLAVALGAFGAHRLKRMREFEQGGRMRGKNARGVRHVRLRAPAGFTLVELLITLVLLIVVVTMYWGFASPSRQHRDQRRCQQNLQKIYVALEIYANDSHGAFPATNTAQTSEEALDVLVPRYTTDTAIFICPGGRDNTSLPSGESFRNRRISYAYYMGRRLSDPPAPLLSDRQVDAKPKNAGDYIFSDTGKPPGNNHHKYGGNILFGDGRVEASPPRAAFALPANPGVALLNPKP